MNYRVTHVCEPIYDLRWRSGKILGIYDRCFNVMTDAGELVTVFKKTDSFSTRAILTDIECSIPSLCMAEGSEVLFDGQFITTGDITFDLSAAEKIVTKRSPVKTRCCGDGILLFADILERHRKKSPVFEDGLVKEKVTRGFEILKADLERGFESLIGLGIGLTPSCDDMLAGMSALFHLTDTGQSFNKALAEFLLKKGDLHTTAVSKSLLSDVACGHVNETLYNVIHSVLVNNGDIEKHTLRLIEVGSSSGSETCAGILIGYNFINDKEQIRWL